jgi:hypothetical protein
MTTKIHEAYSNRVAESMKNDGEKKFNQKIFASKLIEKLGIKDPSPEKLEKYRNLIGTWVRGTAKRIDISHINHVAHILNTDVNTLTGWHEYKNGLNEV